MGIFDPRHMDGGAEPDADREQEDAPEPRAEGAAQEPRTVADDKDPFEDDGGL